MELDIREFLKVICLIIIGIGMCIGGYNLFYHIQSNNTNELQIRKKLISLSYAIISFGFIGYFLII